MEKIKTKQSVRHSFNWSVLLSTLKNTRTRKNLEAFVIAKMKPSLIEQGESNVLNLSVMALLRFEAHRGSVKL